MSERRAEIIPRPSIPPVTWSVVGAWCGAVAAETLTWSGRAQLAIALSIGCLVLAGLAWKKSALIALLAIGVAGGCACGAAFWIGWEADSLAVGAVAGGRTAIDVVSDPVAGKFGSSVDARMLDGPGKGALVKLSIGRGETAALGERLAGWARSRTIQRDERGRRLHREGTVARVTLEAPRREWAPTTFGRIARTRAGVGRLIARAAPGRGGDVLAGLVLGDTTRLAGTPADADFKVCGLSHIVAVSGSHLVIAAALLAGLMGALEAPGWTRLAATVAFGALFVVFTGGQPSAVRAGLMSAPLLLAYAAGRRSDPLGSLAIAAGLMIVAWPPCVFELGFQLSCAAVAGLVIFARLASSWVRSVGPIPRWACDAAGVTLVAQAATIPVTVAVFSVVSLVSPLANLVVGPLVELSLAIGLVGVSVTWLPRAAEACFSLAGWLLDGSCSAAHALASIPSASVLANGWWRALAASVPLFFAGVWGFWPQASRRHARALAFIVALAAVMASIGPPAQGERVVALDVGQGDAIVVASGGHAVLVDCGPSAGALRRALSRARIRSLDAVIVTHLHDDHYGGVEGLRGVVAVGTLYGPAGSAAKLCSLRDASGARDSRELLAGDVVNVGDSARIRVLWPDAAVSDPAENRASVVGVAHVGSRTVLLTGDAEADVLDVLATRGVLPDVDALKVGHHGSDSAIDSGVLAVTRPEEAVISVGAGNRFGHPTVSTLRLLTEAGVRIRRTDREGDVVVGR